MSSVGQRQNGGLRSCGRFVRSPSFKISNISNDGRRVNIFFFVVCSPNTTPKHSNNADDSYRPSAHSIGHPSKEQSSRAAQSIGAIEDAFDRASGQVTAEVVVRYQHLQLRLET